MTNGRTLGVTLELVVNSCRPRGRCKWNIAGKIRNSRQAAMTSGKLISMKCNVLWDSKHLDKIRRVFLDRLLLIPCKVQSTDVEGINHILKSLFLTAMLERRSYEIGAAVRDANDGN